MKSPRYVPPDQRDLSKAPKAKSLCAPCSIIGRNPSGPFKIKCQKCRRWQETAQTIAGAIGKVSAHQRFHATGTT